MAAQSLDVVPVIEKWLEANNKRIFDFWVALGGNSADLSTWARYEIWTTIKQTMGIDATIKPLLREKPDEFIDLLVTSNDSNIKSVAIKIRCERCGWNAGNYEEWASAMDSDMAHVKQVVQDKHIDGEFLGSKFLLVGFSENPGSVEEGQAAFQTKPVPRHFGSSGDVQGWIMEYDIPEDA